MNDNHAHLAFFTPGLSTGGIGKVLLNLAGELLQRGYAVDLVMADTTSPLLNELPSGVRCIQLSSSHAWRCLPSLTGYLRREKPIAVVADRPRLNLAALRAARWCGYPLKTVLSIHNPISVKYQSQPPAKAAKYVWKLEHCLARNTANICVSAGVAADVRECVHLPDLKLHVVYNPVVTADLHRKAAAPCDHPFFREPGIPVILSAGRFTAQKDFATLLQAFRHVLDQRPCRLILLGNRQGRLFSELDRLVRELKMETNVDFPGFDPNPYRYMARADLFVLSSRWEGFGNVLVETLAMGTPVVSTDCPVGPREILEGGRLGPLVPMADPKALADAILRTLQQSVPTDRLKARARQYNAEKSVDGYLAALGLSEANTGPCIPLSRSR